MDAADLRERMAALPEPERTDDLWTAKRRELRDRVLKDNPSDFLTWPTIVSTMWVGEAPYLKAERAAVMAKDPDAYAECLDTNDIHQLYHLSQFLDRSRQSLDAMSSIVEFGGGYGALCRLARACGFNGRYRIIDFPEFLLLQEFYLSAHGVEADYLTLSQVRLVKADLFVAIRSLSEAEAAVGDRVLSRIRARGYLFNYSGARAEDTFTAFAAQNGGLEWARLETAHLPGNYYRIGWTHRGKV